MRLPLQIGRKSAILSGCVDGRNLSGRDISGENSLEVIINGKESEQQTAARKAGRTHERCDEILPRRMRGGAVSFNYSQILYQWYH